MSRGRLAELPADPAYLDNLCSPAPLRPPHQRGRRHPTGRVAPTKPVRRRCQYVTWPRVARRHNSRSHLRSQCAGDANPGSGGRRDRGHGSHLRSQCAGDVNREDVEYVIVARSQCAGDANKTSSKTARASLSHLRSQCAGDANNASANIGAAKRVALTKPVRRRCQPAKPASTPSRERSHLRSQCAGDVNRADAGARVRHRRTYEASAQAMPIRPPRLDRKGILSHLTPVRRRCQQCIRNMKESRTYEAVRRRCQPAKPASTPSRERSHLRSQCAGDAAVKVSRVWRIQSRRTYKAGAQAMSPVWSRAGGLGLSSHLQSRCAGDVTA